MIVKKHRNQEQPILRTYKVHFEGLRRAANVFGELKVTMLLMRKQKEYQHRDGTLKIKTLFVVMYAFSPSTREAEWHISVNSRLAWSM